MSVEDRMRDLWRSGSGDVADDGDGLARIERKVAAAERERRRRRTAYGVLSAAAAAIVVVAGFALVGDGDPQQVDTGPLASDASTSSSSMRTTTVPPPTTEVPPAEEPDRYVWTGEAGSPEEAATTALGELAGMATTVVVDTRDGDDVGGAVTATWEVDVLPREDLRAFVTTVVVHRLEHDGRAYFGVAGSSSPNIQLESPRPGDRIASPFRPVGSARAFEGNVLVSIVQDGGQVLGEGFVTGSGDATPRPVHGEVRFDGPTEDMGAAVLYTSSAEDGRVLEATVVRVGFARCGPFDEAPGAGGRVVLVHFLCGEPASPHYGVVGVERRVGEGSGVLRSALEEQLVGPSAGERARGLFSQFTPEAGGLLRGVTIADGTAVVDFDDRMRTELSAVSTSAGGLGFLDQLDATVFQFPTVERVEYRLDGSCEAFYEWLQSACEVRDRP
jgi:hypothetical protein